MELYAGMDLHSRNTLVGVIDSSFKRVFEKRVPNDLSLIVDKLEPFGDRLAGIVVESTYNWYWLVDGLMDRGYRVHLANPSAIKQYEGLKHTDDRHDAFWLAHMLALGILPEGYIYPKEDRPVRDLLRKRSFLVKHRTAHILSLQSMLEREKAYKLRGNEIKSLRAEDVARIFSEEHLVLSAQANRASIEFFGHHIKRIEKAVRKRVKLRKSFEYLLTVPGIGDILALTIMLEVGDIARFPRVGTFPPMPGVSPVRGYPMVRRRVKETGRTAIAILPGPLLRPRIMPEDTTRGFAATTRESVPKETRQ